MLKKKSEVEVSIIIRIKNEANWLVHSLDALKSQTFKNFETIIVDNNSEDDYLSIANQHNIKKIVKINSYKPGKALNLGINRSIGKYLVFLSAHCIPKNNFWLENLIDDLKDEKVAGVYGRQEPLSFTPDADKRDLDLVFGLDKIIQTRGSFFHNANSAIKKKIWKKIKFDNNVSNIEDRLWAKKVLKSGYKIIYEPMATVYHHHGIHHNGNSNRLKNVVNILEKEEIIKTKNLKRNNLVCYGFIPVLGKVQSISKTNPLEITVNQLRKNRFIKKIILTTNSRENIKLAEKLNIDYIIKRPNYLSKTYLTTEDILFHSLQEIKKINNEIPDYVLYTSINNLFRHKKLFLELYNKIKSMDYSKVFPVIEEKRSLWNIDTDKYSRLDQGTIPSDFKKGFYIGLSGLGTMYKVEDLIFKNSERNISTITCKDNFSLIDNKNLNNKNTTKKIVLEWIKKN